MRARLLAAAAVLGAAGLSPAAEPMWRSARFLEVDYASSEDLAPRLASGPVKLGLPFAVAHPGAKRRRSGVVAPRSHAVGR